MDQYLFIPFGTFFGKNQPNAPEKDPNGQFINVLIQTSYKITIKPVSITEVCNNYCLS